MTDIGLRIKRIRKELKLTQAELGKKCGVSSVAVGYWEANAHTPDGKSLTLLAKALHCSGAWIIEGKGSPSQPVHVLDVPLLAKAIGDIEIILELLNEFVEPELRAEMIAQCYAKGGDYKTSDVTAIISHSLTERNTG